MSALLAIADAIRRMLQAIAFASGWLLVVLMVVTCFNVAARKVGVPFPLTLLQELEWHLHTAIFSLWMGYCYVINAHPRVDSYTGTLGQRSRAWIELAGCLVFAAPYMAVICLDTVEFVVSAYEIGEGSPSSVGLNHRWIIKTIYSFGLWLVLVGIASVMLRLVVVLFGGRSPKEADLDLGAAELEV